MFLARVIGHVWSSVKWDSLDGLRFLLVRPYNLDDLRRVAGGEAALAAARSDGVVVADVLGAGPGEDVLVAYGHAARAGIEELEPDGAPPKHPIDAAIVAIVDRYAVTEGRGSLAMIEGGGNPGAPGRSTPTPTSAC
jgi:ethanolamine utilization protein EutN